MAPPAAQGQELDEAVFGDLFDHETDLIEMSGNQHARFIRCPAFSSDERSEPVEFH